MEVCCLKMASRCRNSRPEPIDVARIPTISTSHDCGSLARVVMVRKTDQRMINHKRPQSDPQCEIVTFETIQTYKGHKPDRTVVFKEKLDMVESEVQKSPSAQRFSIGTKSVTPERTLTPARSTGKLDRLTNGEGSKLINGGVSTPRHRSPTTQRSIFTEFEKICLKAHNDFRIKHGVQPLRLNKKLCRIAEEWAKVLAARGTPIHRNNSPYGENIFCSWCSNSNVQVPGWEPVEHWYGEGVNHVFGKEPTTLKTGHFTQVIWKDSRELGVGEARNRSGQVYVVANYDPPGNFIGSFTENVPPIGGFSTPPKIVIDRITDSPDSLRNDDTDELMNFRRGMLKCHNDFRKRHSSPELKLCPKMNEMAQQWAEILAREDRFSHRPYSNYGENIYCLWSSDRNAKVNPRDVCRSWYEEKALYNFSTEPKGAFKGGHFTQMIWKECTDVGVGVAKTKKGKVLVVCNYNPRGNVIGQFMANIIRAR